MQAVGRHAQFYSLIGAKSLRMILLKTDVQVFDKHLADLSSGGSEAGSTVFYGPAVDTDLTSSWDSKYVYADIWKSELGLANKVKRTIGGRNQFLNVFGRGSSSFLLPNLFRTSLFYSPLLPLSSTLCSPPPPHSPTPSLCIRRREFTALQFGLCSLDTRSCY